MPKLYFAADHAGFVLKNVLMQWAREQKYEVEDLGAHELDPEDDYPDFITPCAEKVAGESAHAGSDAARGIIIGGSGQGEAMCANRIPGARAAVFYGAPSRLQTDIDGVPLDVVASVRTHNNANILSLGARFITEAEAEAALKAFLDTPFLSPPRHVRRIAKF